MEQLPLKRDSHVRDLFLVDEEVGVAGDAKLVAAQHGHAREQFTHMAVEDRGEEDEFAAAAAELRGKADEPRQGARRLHNGCTGTAPERIAAFELDHEVQTLVEHLGEGVRRIQADRREDRQQLAEEIFADPLALRRVPVRAAAKVDAFGGKLREQDFVEEPVLRIDKRAHLADYKRVDLRRAFSVGTGLVDIELDLFLEPRDADLDELIEVGRNDAEETQPLQQRHRFVRCLCQHAPVELEDAEFPVEEVSVG